MPKSEMVSKRKLEEAEYFLDAMREEQEPEHFYYKLSAFLGASHSAVDIIIYDFVEMRGLGITRDDRLDTQTFELVAKAHGVKEEMEFSSWISEKFGQLSSKPIWKMRKFVTHRGYPDLQREKEIVYVSGNPPMGFSANTTSHSGTITLIGPPAALAKFAETKSKVRFSLKEEGSKDVYDVCKDLYEEIKVILDEAEKKFWV